MVAALVSGLNQVGYFRADTFIGAATEILRAQCNTSTDATTQSNNAIPPLSAGDQIRQQSDRQRHLKWQVNASKAVGPCTFSYWKKLGVGKELGGRQKDYNSVVDDALLLLLAQCLSTNTREKVSSGTGLEKEALAQVLDNPTNCLFANVRIAEMAEETHRVGYFIGGWRSTKGFVLMKKTVAVEDITGKMYMARFKAMLTKKHSS